MPNFRLYPSAFILRRIGTYPLALLVLIGIALYILLAPRVISPPDETWTRIQTERVLRIGIDPSFPPFETDDGQGHLAGFDIALVYALAERFSANADSLVRIEYVYTGFDGLYDALLAKQYDLILSALPYNPDKTQDVNFSHAYYDGGPVIVVRGDASTKKQLTLFDLQNKRVAVELGSTGDMLLRRWTRRLRLNVLTFDTTRDALAAVQSNSADAALVDSLSFFEFQREGGRGGVTPPLQIVSAPLEHEYLVISARKDSSTLLRNVNGALDEWKQTGRLEEMLREAVNK